MYHGSLTLLLVLTLCTAHYIVLICHTLPTYSNSVYVQMSH